MNIHDIRKKHFDLFSQGESTIFIIAENNAIKSNLLRSDIITRKIDDKKKSIPGWRIKEEADLFLNTSVKKDNFTVIEITANDLRTLLKNYSENEREAVLLDLI